MTVTIGRRELLVALGGAAVSWPIAARAAGPRPRIAVLSINSEQDERKNVVAFVDGLRALGYVTSQNVDIDYRYAEGDTTRLKPLAQELISVTGMASTVEGVATKLLELALDAVPGSTRIGFLANPAGASMALWVQQVETAARARGVTLLIQEARTPDDLAPAFDGLAKQRSQAVIVPANGLFQTERTRIVQLALAARLPTIMAYPQDVEVGGLASYGVDARENYRRAAAYVDKILKGAKPGDLPIEFPTKLMLAINLKTARALGLEVPLHLQQLADEVIE